MRINDTDISVDMDGEGPAVLMIHGLGGTSNFYQVQADALATSHTVIRPDSAGAGRSSLRQDISIESHADDLAALLEELGIETAAVVAHSMGTLIARTLVNRHPGKVSKLALLGAVREPAEAGRQAQRDRASTLRSQGTAPVAAGVVANALSQRTRTEKPEVAAFVRELIMRQPVEGYARNCEALAAATDPGPIDPAIRLLLVTGDEDAVGPPEASRELADAHGNADVHVIEGVGHWTALEAADDVSRLLVAFLD